MNKNLKKIFNDSVYYGLSSVVPRLINFLLVPLYTYIFSPYYYGIVGDLYTWALLLNIILTFGLETGLLRFYNQTDDSKNIIYSTAFFTLLLLNVTFLLLIIFNAYTFSNILGYDFKYLIILVALIIFFDCLSALNFTKLRAENKVKKFFRLKIINVSINVFLNVFFYILIPHLINVLKLNVNYQIDIIYIFISNFFATFITFLFTFEEIPNIKFFSYKVSNKILFYSFPLMIAGLMGSFNDVIDRQFIKYFSPVNLNGVEQLGIYFANIKIAVFVTLLIQAYRYAGEPLFFKLKNDNKLKDDFPVIFKFFVAFILFSVLLIYGNIHVIKYYIGSLYWEGLKIIPYVLLANVLIGIYFNLSFWIKIIDKTYIGIIIMGVALLYNIISNYFTVPLYGYTAAAFNRMVSFLIMNIICIYLANKFYKINYPVNDLIYYFLIFISFFTIQIIINNYDEFNTIIKEILNNFMILIYVLLFIKREKLLSLKFNLKYESKSSK